ncbi:hypothetical protein CONPUDRAFT_158928 [Coniophora puteana RWD-64-598 SS2]|uniref:Uncharacterized protein n=1 Tax=Coniophora puteana (strain RWD-64-598) TaxID=741705 RepID=A0A5M3M8S1_CONPW|nr:uncharacterized protein CONPUDRAFT_158928 [Coniophora puteana RWD-64-598 SS2]EIW75467.1 hypothetical protein CONPUDRAFT_158928 [Coniophora puteana RWD-64-598 SS2]
MAAVMGPSIAQHPSPFRAAHNVSVSQSSQGFHTPPSCYPSPPKLVRTLPTLPAPLAHLPAPSYLPPDTPETPSPLYLTSSSPTLTISPNMPHGVEDHTAQIVSAESLTASKHDGTPVRDRQHQVLIDKSKMFAFAVPPA